MGLFVYSVLVYTFQVSSAKNRITMRSTSRNQRGFCDECAMNPRIDESTSLNIQEPKLKVTSGRMVQEATHMSFVFIRQCHVGLPLWYSDTGLRCR